MTHRYIFPFISHLYRTIYIYCLRVLNMLITFSIYTVLVKRRAMSFRALNWWFSFLFGLFVEKIPSGDFYSSSAWRKHLVGHWQLDEGTQNHNFACRCRSRSSCLLLLLFSLANCCLFRGRICSGRMCKRNIYPNL